jgi:serine/threonine protein kinase/WD40 repeat protein
MNRPDEPYAATPTVSENGTGDQASAVDDPRVIAAVEEYLAALEAGLRPNRQQFLARHPQEIAQALAECLDGLEMVQSAGAGLQPRPVGAPPQVLGDFRIVREIGRGGMGVVYEAEQISLRRRVALKILSAVGGLDDRQLQRFRTEAQAAGALHHPHIAPVYAVGSEQGVHYYAMQFIDGPSLASVIAGRRRQEGLSPRIPIGHYGLSARPAPLSGAESDSATVYRPLDRLEQALVGATASPNDPLAAASLPDGREYWQAVARLGIEAAEALDHAHQEGIVHRDIKPANLLLDGRGQLWVVDFGLARLPTDTGLTMTGDLVGTLRYMSPEQALAKRAVVDHRTDVYSLGATLYELLTLTPAFPGNDRPDVLRRIADEEPPAPRRLDRVIPVELETIVLKAMAKAPTDRYATAQDLADDLRRFMEDRPILARRPSPAQRARRWARRHQGLVVSVVTAAIVLVLGLALGYASQKQRLAEKEKEAREEVQAALSEKLVQHARAVRGEHRPGYRTEVWDDLHKAVKLTAPDEDRAAVAAEILACLGDPIGLPTLKDPDAPRAFPPPPPVQADGSRQVKTPDGKVQAVAGGDVVTLLVSDVPPVASPRGQVNELRFSGDGSLLAAGCEQGFVIWDVAGLNLRASIGGGSVFSLAFHPKGRLLATVGRKVDVWSLSSFRLVASMPMPDPALDVEFSADGQLLLGFVNGKAKYGWPVGDTPEKRRLEGHQKGVPGVAFSPDGRLLASVSKDKVVKIWDAATGRLLHTCQKHTREVECLAFSPDGRLLATGDLLGTVNVWDPTSGALLAQPPGSGTDLGDIWRLQFDAAGKTLAAAGMKGVAAWTVRPREGGVTFEQRVNLPTAEVSDVAMRPDGSALVFLARAKPDQPAHLHRYDLHQKAAPRQMDAPVWGHPRSLYFDPAGRLLTYLTPEGRLGRWDWEKGAALPAADIGQPVYQIALSPDGRRVATASPDRSIVICDLETGKRLLALPPEEGDIWSLAWSPDGRRLAVGLSDGGLAVWDLEKVRARLAEFDIDLPWKSAAKN